MEYLYWAYTHVFRCARRVKKIFVDDVETPIALSNATWLSVYAEHSNGDSIDVTREVKYVFQSGILLTPDILARGLSMYNVRDWYYLTKTLEYNKIEDEGVVNGL